VRRYPGGPPRGGLHLARPLGAERRARRAPPEEGGLGRRADTAVEADTEAVTTAEQEAGDRDHDERLDTSGLRLSLSTPAGCRSAASVGAAASSASGFTEGTQIWWHDHFEPTVFESEQTDHLGDPWAFANPDVIRSASGRRHHRRPGRGEGSRREGEAPLTLPFSLVP
jgi:hypothetical protein